MRLRVLVALGAVLLLPAIASADEAKLTIRFPEGQSVRQMTDRVSAVREIAIHKRHVTPALTGTAYAAAAAAARPPAPFAGADKRHSIEGFLFPSTYFFDPTTTGKALVTEQVQTFLGRWATVTLGSRAKKVGPYGVLTIASMVEREAAIPSERPLIAAVIYNRLDKGMALGIDATIRYYLRRPNSLHHFFTDDEAVFCQKSVAWGYGGC